MSCRMLISIELKAGSLRTMSRCTTLAKASDCYRWGLCWKIYWFFLCWTQSHDNLSLKTVTKFIGFFSKKKIFPKPGNLFSILFDNFLYQYISQGLEINCKSCPFLPLSFLQSAAERGLPAACTPRQCCQLSQKLRAAPGGYLTFLNLDI